MDSKWAEQAHLETSSTAASVARHERLRVTEEETVTTEQEAPLPAAASVVSREGLRVAKAEAPQLKIEQEASLSPAERRRRALRAKAQRVEPGTWAEQAHLETSSTTASVARPERPRVAEEQSARLKAGQEELAVLAVEEEKRALRAEGVRSLEGKRAERAERDAPRTSVANLKRLHVAEKQAAQLKAGQHGAAVPVAERRRALRAEGRRVLASKWADQSERDATRTAANLERVRAAENRASQLKVPP